MDNISPFGTLLTAIQNRIKNQVPEIRETDQDLGQLEEEQPPVSFPCLLVDFVEWQFEDMADGGQRADGLVQLRLCATSWSNTSSLAPGAVINKGLAIYDLEWKVFKALHRWMPESYGHLMRTGVTTEKREDNLRVRILTLSCNFEDYLALVQLTQATLPPLEIEISTPTSASAATVPEVRGW